MSRHLTPMLADLRRLLMADAAVMSAAPGGIDWAEHPQDVAHGTYVVLTLIDAGEGLTQGGPDALLTARVQVDCYALALLGAAQAATTVASVLDGYRNGAFALIRSAGSRSLREDGDPVLHRVSSDYIINYGG
ncbi:DUF3168 domain-containing protein [Paracoccus sp. p3-h83]|uniref:tail completion protein gp17 n=1 Tax=Paracoccus sp. p3-h83 TaxID=3342805 RepID=UPI0035B7A8DE